MTRLSTGIAVSYAKAWTIELAIREILQNWLDTRLEGSSGGIDWSDGIATIWDDGPGLEPRHLALGVSEKCEGAIGQFGEGLKLAFLVLVREGRAVQLRTHRTTIAPVIDRDAGFGIETLQYELSVSPSIVGTRVTVECTEEELEAGKHFFPALRPDEVLWLDDAKTVSSPGGEIFVNGSKILDIENALFSYHLSGEETRSLINRDRGAVHPDELEVAVADVLLDVGSQYVMETVLRDVLRGGRSWETQLSLCSWRLSAPQRAAWTCAWRSVSTGREVLAGGEQENRVLEARGFIPLVRLAWRWISMLSALGVPTAKEMLEESSKKVEIVPSDLNDDEIERLAWVRQFVTTHYAPCGDVVVLDMLDPILPKLPASVLASGLYDPGRETIFLARETLTNRRILLHAVLHETVHKVTGYDDLSSEFETALLDAGLKCLEAYVVL